jgi:hypothetical protein
MKQVDRHIAQIDYLMTAYFARHERKTAQSIQKTVHIFLKRDARLQRELPPGLTVVRAARPFQGNTPFNTLPYRGTHLPLDTSEEK